MRSAFSLLGWLVIFGLLTPILLTLWVSFSPDSFLTPPTTTWSLRWYEAFAVDNRWSAALLRSLLVAISAGFLSLLLTTPVALVTHDKQWLGQPLFLFSLLAPLAIPPAAFGIATLPLLHRIGLWGHWLGLILVHVTLLLPVSYLILRTHCTSRLLELQTVARGLGANAWQVFWRISLPLLTPAMVVAFVAVFVMSLNEAFVTLFLATPRTETIPALIWPQLKHSPNPVVAVASLTTATIGTLGLCFLLRFWKDKS